MARLKEQFLKDHYGKTIRLFLVGGFQMSCRIIDYDEECLKVTTSAYGNENQCVLIPYSAISTYVSLLK